MPHRHHPMCSWLLRWQWCKNPNCRPPPYRFQNLWRWQESCLKTHNQPRLGRHRRRTRSFANSRYVYCQKYRAKNWLSCLLLSKCWSRLKPSDSSRHQRRWQWHQSLPNRIWRQNKLNRHLSHRQRKRDIRRKTLHRQKTKSSRHLLWP